MIKSKIEKHPCLSSIIIFAICTIARCVEYFFIRTDETVIAENFIHKVFGIIVLFIVLKILHLTWNSIGFKSEKILKTTAWFYLLYCFVWN